MRSLFLVALIFLSGCAVLEKHAEEHPETTAAQAVFTACRAADVWTTLRVLGQGGKELNPFMAGFVHSIPQFILVESILTAMVLWAEDKIDPNVALGIAAASCLPAIHNAGQIRGSVF